MGYGQPIGHPLAAATLSEVHDYPWPDPESMDVSEIRASAQACAGRYAVLGGDCSPFWHDAIDLIGMENLYLKMYDEPEYVDALMEHVVAYYEAVSRRIFDAAADAIDIFFIGNDFGGRIVFNGAIDSQHVLIDGTPPSVRADPGAPGLEIMMPGGGYVAGASHDMILKETPVENVLAMFDAVREFGVYG